MSPKAPARGSFRERRIENVGAGLAAGAVGMRSVPCFQEVDFGPGRNSRNRDRILNQNQNQSRNGPGAIIGGANAAAVHSAPGGSGQKPMTEVRNGWGHGFGGKLVGGGARAAKGDRKASKVSVKTVRLSEYVVGEDDGLGVLTKEIMKL